MLPQRGQTRAGPGVAVVWRTRGSLRVATQSLQGEKLQGRMWGVTKAELVPRKGRWLTILRFFGMGFGEEANASRLRSDPAGRFGTSNIDLFASSRARARPRKRMAVEARALRRILSAHRKAAPARKPQSGSRLKSKL